MVYGRVRLFRYYLDERFHKNTHNNGIFLVSHYLNTITGIYLTKFECAFCSLYCCCIYIFRYSLIFEQSSEDVYFIISSWHICLCISPLRGTELLGDSDEPFSVSFSCTLSLSHAEAMDKRFKAYRAQAIGPPSLFWLFFPWNQRKESFLLDEVLKINL